MPQAPGATGELPASTPLGPDSDPAFDRIAELVSDVLVVPAALVSFVDGQGQVFPGATGLPEPWASQRATPLSHSFCQYVVRSGEPLIVNDSERDERVRGNEAIQDLGVAAYAGMPLVDENGVVTGSLCAIDHEPRAWTDKELKLLAGLAAACSAELQLRGAFSRVARRETELQASEERFRIAFDEAGIAMTLTGLLPEDRGRFLRANAAMGQLLGLAADELVGRSFAEFTHPDDLAESSAIAERLAEGEVDRWETQKRYRRADGSYVWIQLSVASVRDDQGRPTHGISQFIDITAARDRWDQLESRFDDLADNVDVGFTLRAVEPLEYLYANPAYFRLFGFDPAGPFPTVDDVVSRFHPDEPDPSVTVTELARTGRPFETDFRLLLPDGTDRWLQAKFTPILDADGQMVRFATIYDDITVRRAAQDAERESRTRFDQLARSTEVGFFLREDAEMLFMNGAFLRLFDLDPDVSSADANDLLAKLHPEDFARAEAIMVAANRGESNAVELRINRRDGAVRWLHITNDAVLDPGGQLIRVAGTVEDITDRKAAEAAVLAARDEAERANEAKDEFLSRMSHELRTPLNAILGFAQLMELDGLAEPHGTAVAQILNGGTHLLAMVNDILDITTLDADQLAMTVEDIAVDAVVADMVALMQPLAEAGNVVLYVGAQGIAADRRVSADRRRVNQVLLNLLSNAIKYNRPGGQVTITLGPVDDGFFSIAVADTGIGIPADDLPRIFSPFDRLGRQSLNIDGTGIGLTLTRRLVAAMGGRIGVTSTDGVGSTFTVILPRPSHNPYHGPTQNPSTSPPPVDSAGSADAVVSAGATAPPSLLAPPRRILYVEDNLSNAELMAGLIRRRAEWELIHVIDGQGAQAALAGQRPDVILLDLHLPDTDGIEILRAVRADPALAEVPVAVLSADASQRQVRSVLDAGAEVYLTKPLKVKEILDFLDRYSG